MTIHSLPLLPIAAAEPKPDTLSGVQHRRKRLIFFSSLLLVAAFLFSESLWPSGSLLHEVCEMAGYAMIFICIAGRSWCALYIGGRKKAELIQDGPYSLSRNPLYVFSLLGGVGIGLQAGNLTAGVVCGLFVFAVFSAVIQREESFLESRFPAEFAGYAAMVPRWGPRFSAWASREELVVRPHFALVTFRDALAFALAIPLLEVIEWAQDAGWLPVLLHLP
jgi:protein-S-isoprenylcysteine O-methyltransferase Ste14